ncbi:MAG: hypothetical protein WKG03_00375 [Telluria sp.]
MAIAKAIYLSGPTTPANILDELQDRFVRFTVQDKIVDMISSGTLVREGEKLALAVGLRRHFEQCDSDLDAPVKPTGVMATSRAPKPFTPLAGYSLPRDGARDGADDHRKYKSRHF